MTDDGRARKVVFREKAHRLYLRNEKKIVVLRLARPSFFPVFWGLLAGLLLLIGVIWNADVPVMERGVGVVIEDTVDDGMLLVSLLPPQTLSRIGIDQRVTAFAADDPRQIVLVARVEEVVGDLLSPEAIAQRFELDQPQPGVVVGPAALAVARIEEERGETGLELYLGSRLPVEIEVGTRPVLSLIPAIGRFF